MTESMYDHCLFYRYGSLKIIKIQTNNILIIVNNNFASNTEKTIKIAKLITKNCKNFIFA